MDELQQIPTLRQLKPRRFPLLKSAIRELLHRPVAFGDDHKGLEDLFRWSEDPWNFRRSPYEQDRMFALLQLIKQHPHDTILEIGCAEGFFSGKLSKIAKQVVAIDVSETAIERAKIHYPDVTFVQTSLEEFSWNNKFDIVICAETLYYMQDIESAIQKLSGLGRYCLVSYNRRKNKRLDPFFKRMDLIEYKKFQKRYWVWTRSMKMALWKNKEG
ncbi:MAG TPA: SAM-dependent methyltransferase [Bacteroidota bacterium]|nr:SAM-dependent methyltransferase [Bacteroidota bacterium]